MVSKLNTFIRGWASERSTNHYGCDVARSDVDVFFRYSWFWFTCPVWLSVNVIAICLGRVGAWIRNDL